MKNYFTGRYYKHQKEGNTVSFIIGHTAEKEFIQILTNYEVIQYESLDGCKIYRNGLQMNYPELKGSVRYGSFLPLRSLQTKSCNCSFECNMDVAKKRD